MTITRTDAEKANPLKIGMDALGWVGEKQDQLDKAVGIGQFNVYNARHLLIDPVTKAATRLHPAAGVAANVGMEMLVPDSTLYAGKILKGIRGIGKVIKGTRPAYAYAGVAGDVGRVSNVKISKSAQPLMIKGGDTGKALTKSQYKAKAYNLHVTEGLDMKSVKKQMGGFWIDPKDGTEWAVHTDKGKGVKMIGRKARGTRDIKRKQMTLDQSTGVGEDTFVKYDSKGNISDLLVKEGDEIHHWNSLIDKSSAYVDLSRKEAQELTTMVRDAGWFFGDNKGNLLKMVREDHKKIHAWMRKNGIEGVKAQKLMEKHYKGKSVKQRFEILKGFMEYVQGGVDEELIRMGYKMSSSHKAAQKANRAVQQKFIKGK